MIIKVLVFTTKADVEPKHFKKASEDLKNYAPITNYTGMLVELDLSKLDGNVKIVLQAADKVRPYRQQQPVVNIIKPDQDEYSVEIEDSVMKFQAMTTHADVIISHNMQLHRESMYSEILNLGLPIKTSGSKSLCLMKYGTHIMKIPGRYEGQYKFPTIREVVKYFTAEELSSYKETFGEENSVIIGMLNTFINILKQDEKIKGWIDGSKKTMF